ncbi:MAG: tape measure protein, partial [Alphaproteobacteria bacterium]
SFVGFYGVFRTGNSILTSFDTVQAANTRLMAAFNQDAALTRAEMDFLRQEADRLNIQFGVLADSYSKFLISGQQAGIETSKLRTVFRQVAEAGRVLKLSNDQIEGTLTALSQIAGKGTLQMEELRQQLGDRIPGAVGLVAQALGYGTDELDKFYKAVENGQIGAEDALVALGQGLEDTFGDQLAEALENTRSKIGSVQDLLFQRQLTAANSGFIAGLETALESLERFLESEDGIALFTALGAAFGEIFELLPGIVDNLDLIVVAFKTFVAIKAAQVASGLAGNFARMAAPTEASRQAMLRFNASLYALSPAAFRAVTANTALGASLRGLRAAFFSVATAARAVVASVGGPIGIAVAALSYFALDGMGGVDEAAQELDKTLRAHEEQMSKIRGAYLRAKEGADDWKGSLE